MREIKFRAWATEVKEMVSDVFFDNLEVSVWGEDGELEIVGDRIPNRLLQYCILMQFTGLKDKNGKEIYEGDIVRNHWYRINGDYLGHDWVVKFGEHMTSGDYYNCDAYGWYVEGINPEADEPEHTLHDLPADGDKGVEVIGNIYENPELL